MFLKPVKESRRGNCFKQSFILMSRQLDAELTGCVTASACSTQGYDQETVWTIIRRINGRSVKRSAANAGQFPAEWDLRKNNRPVIELNPGAFGPPWWNGCCCDPTFSPSWPFFTRLQSRQQGWLFAYRNTLNKCACFCFVDVNPHHSCRPPVGVPQGSCLGIPIDAFFHLYESIKNNSSQKGNSLVLKNSLSNEHQSHEKPETAWSRKWFPKDAASLSQSVGRKHPRKSPLELVTGWNIDFL